MGTPARTLLWMIETDPTTPLGPALQVALPDGLVTVEAALDAPWRGPQGHRPVAVVVGIPSSGAEEALEVVRRVGDRTHLPLVVLFERRSADLRHAALRAGATAILTLSSSDPTQKRIRRQLVSTLSQEPSTSERRPSRTDIQVIVVGSSTGGPETIAQILEGHGPFDAPVVIAQHVHPGYDASLATFLTDRGLGCRVAEAGEPVAGSRVLLAPAGHDLVIRRGRVRLEATRSQYVPCVDALFESAAIEYGRSALGILLTGMGDDGATGLLALNQAGAFTIAQSSETCVVDGMPAS
ncbi:MAG: CheB methylesterase domain-containing protein, partial [Myxococcota bacterium]